VLGANVRMPHEVIVVDDASPEPELSAWLREAAAGGRFTLLVHERNAGFVASVNEGMRLHPDRDVLLLNSDTEVAGDWLDRIASCAARDPRTGTVTPFSNNATICSYPRFAQSNPLPAGVSAARLDSAFARANGGRAVEIPTAVGFCMFIARGCLDEVGLFDEEAFGRGYGEEVDFCMRAARAGWRHWLAADTFVFHEGEVSFGGGAQEIRDRAQAIVDGRYPEFQTRVREFIAADPPRVFRERATEEMLPLARRLAARIRRRLASAAPGQPG
jgi:GT2 family glycosyltransferase